MAMQPQETGTRSITTNQHTQAIQRSARYTKVLDGRKQPIRGLWMRNERFYAQLTIEDHATGRKAVRRVPLLDEATKKPTATAAEAVKAMERLKVQREDNALPVLKRTPKFSECVVGYFEHFKKLTGAKRASTLQKEKTILTMWGEHIGGVRVDKISKAMLNHVRAERQAAGMSARTVNLDMIVLRNLLNFARDNEWLTALPYVKPLKTAPKKRPFFSAAEIDAVCEAAVKKSKNGREFSDYVRLMAYCGSRRDETLRLKWDQVNWQMQQLTIGADGLSKNYEARQVDFNGKLEAHLKDMFARRAPDSEYLFPSPQRGDKDRSTKTFKETLRAARLAAKLPNFNFHDCRHYFISMAVMSGIDYMTISRWVGHRDGGVLIGRVYGHLSNEHAQIQARRVDFAPRVLESAEQTG
jgi:integrase